MAIVMQISKVLIMPVLSSLLRRYPCGNVMLTAQLLGGTCTLLMAIQVFFLGRNQVAFMLPLQSAASMAEAALMLCFVSLIPVLNPGGTQRARANGLFACADGLVVCFAPFAGSWLLVSVGLMGVLLIDAFTFVVSIGCLLRCWLPPITQTWPAAKLLDQGRPLRLRQLFRLKPLRAQSVLSGVMAWVYASTEVLFPAQLITETSGSRFELALILAALGYIVGFKVWSYWAWQWPGVVLVAGLFAQSLILMGSVFVLFNRLLLIWSIGVFLFCASLPLALAALQCRWQRSVPLAGLPDLLSQRLRLEWIARLSAFAAVAVLVDKLMNPLFQSIDLPNALIQILVVDAGRPFAAALGLQGAILFAAVLAQWREYLSAKSACDS